jgi:hypothetical protein
MAHHAASTAFDAPPIAPHRPSSERGRHRGQLVISPPPTPPTLELPTRPSLDVDAQLPRAVNAVLSGGVTGLQAMMSADR